MPDSPRDVSLCEGGVKGRKPSRLLLTDDPLVLGRDSVGRAALSLRDSPKVEFEDAGFEGVRELLELGGVKGRYAPRLPFSADEILALRFDGLFVSRGLFISRFRGLFISRFEVVDSRFD